MTCNHCVPWAAKSDTQWRNRQYNIRNAPDVQFHVCPVCGNTDWATTRRYIRPQQKFLTPGFYVAAGIVIATLFVVFAILMFTIRPASALECRSSAGSGGYWSWRLIDGRKCWYRGTHKPDKSALRWPDHKSPPPRIRPRPPAPYYPPNATIAERDEIDVLNASIWPPK